MVFVALRDSAGGDDEVVAAGGVVQGEADGLPTVGEDPEVRHLAAEALEEGDPDEPIGVVDAARRERRTRLPQLVAGGEDRHLEPRAAPRVAGGAAADEPEAAAGRWPVGRAVAVPVDGRVPVRWDGRGGNHRFGDHPRDRRTEIDLLAPQCRPGPHLDRLQDVFERREGLRNQIAAHTAFTSVYRSSTSWPISRPQPDCL